MEGLRFDSTKYPNPEWFAPERALKTNPNALSLLYCVRQACDQLVWVASLNPMMSRALMLKSDAKNVPNVQ